MAQVVVNPNEIRSFITELKRFKNDMDTSKKQLNSKLSTLGESWDDNEQKKFNNNFEVFLRNLIPFSSNIDEYCAFLQRKTNALHRSIYIKDTVILDNIKIVFNDALNEFQNNIENVKSKYLNIFKSSEEKVHSTQMDIHHYSNDVLILEQNEFSINNQLTSLEIEITSLSSQLVNAKEEYQKSSISSEISANKTKIGSLHIELNNIKSNIHNVKQKLDNSRYILSNIQHIPTDLQNNIDKYNYTIIYIKNEASNILDDTFKSIESIKNTIDTYQSIQSSTSMNLNSTAVSKSSDSVSENNTIKKDVTTKINNTLELDLIVNFEYMNVKYKIENVKKVNRFVSELFFDNAKVAKLSFKIKNDSITILNYSSDYFKNIEVVIYYLGMIIENNLNINTILIWAKESDISNFKSLDFKQNEKIIKGDGVSMIKNYKEMI